MKAVVRVALNVVFLGIAFAATDGPAPSLFGTTRMIPNSFAGRVFLLHPESFSTRLENSIGIVYTRSLYIPPREFSEGFPGITPKSEWFAIDYSGTFHVTSPGNYHFRLKSEDGSQLIIDDHLLLRSTGRGKFDRAGDIRLKPGNHEIRVTYYREAGSQVCLVLSVKAPGEKEERPFDLGDFSNRASTTPASAPPVYVKPATIVMAPQDRLRLDAIKARMTGNLQHLPNFTCLETIVRSRRGPSRLMLSANDKPIPFRKVDVVRLDVAQIDKDEFFARPGTASFETREPSAFAAGGLMGKGAFMLFAHDIFETKVADFWFTGPETMDGQTLLRYDFHMAVDVSKYLVTTPYAIAMVAYHGSFWADPKTLDVARLDATTDSIPPTTRLAELSDRIDYARTRIGDADVLLPQTDEQVLVQLSEWQNRNDIAFSHCRAYTADSNISFGDATVPSTAESARVRLPSGLTVAMRLETGIDSNRARVGDILTAHTDNDVAEDGRVLIPKGSPVSGRIRQLRKVKDNVEAELEFIRVASAGGSARFFADLERIEVPRPGSSVRKLPNPELLGVARISVSGSRLLLPAGTRLEWRTRLGS